MRYKGWRDQMLNPIKQIYRFNEEADLSSHEHSDKDIDTLVTSLNTIVSNFNSIFQLGLTPQEAMNALNIIVQSNIAELHDIKDIIPPEPRLQKILDKRR